MDSIIKNNWNAIDSYLLSMRCACDKAERGSETEDMYFFEKLNKLANYLGYNLVKRK